MSIPPAHTSPTKEKQQQQHQHKRSSSQTPLLGKDAHRFLYDASLSVRRSLSDPASMLHKLASFATVAATPRHLHHGVPSHTVTMAWAGLYIFSGICQPLIMTLCREAGLGDATAQLYMFFYYLGGPVLLLSLIDKNSVWPPRSIIMKACGIAILDIFSQALNYTGAGMAGPTVFAIVYSSVTIWTAVFSLIFLQRTMILTQWIAVFIVFGGLTITATDSVHLGPNVRKGTMFVVIGSMIHGSAYVFSEAIMKVTTEKLTVRQNAGIQGTVAFIVLGFWQIVYTLPNYDELIATPMKEKGTSVASAGTILMTFAIANIVHSLTFGHTLKYYPGGATSAGVMKGLQAVLVFVAAHFLYCGRVGGNEMCFTTTKLFSLMTVIGGVTMFGIVTEKLHSASPGGRRIRRYSLGGEGDVAFYDAGEYEEVNDDDESETGVESVVFTMSERPINQTEYGLT